MPERFSRRDLIAGAIGTFAVLAINPRSIVEKVSSRISNLVSRIDQSHPIFGSSSVNRRKA